MKEQIKEKIKMQDENGIFKIQEIRNIFLKSKFYKRNVLKKDKIKFLCNFGIDEEIAEYIIDDLENGGVTA